MTAEPVPGTGPARDAVDFRLVFEHVPGLYLILDPDLRIVAVSEAFLAAMRIQRKQLVGRKMLEVFNDDPDNERSQGEGTMRGSLERVRRRREPDSMAVQQHYIQSDKDGDACEVRWLCADNVPVLATTGELRYIIHRVEDVTGLARREASVRSGPRADRPGMDAETAPSERFRHHNEKLREDNKELRHAGRMTNEFLSRMSHEMRTPLTAIGGFSELLALDEPDRERHRWASTIHHASQHLLALVSDVLDISRVEGGGLPMSVEPVLLSEVLEAVLELTEPLAKRKEVQFLMPDGHGSETWVYADPQRLKQVIINLVVNAIRYNHRGGEVRLVISTATSPVTWGGETVRIEIVDTGEGIADTSLAKLFIAFERLDQDEESAPGTGLGLALSRSLTESMGGTIGVSSTVGRGSTFWIDLPRVEEPEVHSAPRQDPPPSLATRVYAARFRLLYIEDTMSNLRFVEAVMRRRPSVEVLTVMLGYLGLELARANPPDLILLDLHLPDIGGDAVLAQLQVDPRTRDIPVVILSADDTDAARAPVLEGGASAFLSKPISVIALLELVDGFAVMPA